MGCGKGVAPFKERPANFGTFFEIACSGTLLRVRDLTFKGQWCQLVYILPSRSNLHFLTFEHSGA